MLVESWLTSSVEDRESFSSPDDMRCTELSYSCSNKINDPLYLRRFLRESLEFPKGNQATWSVWWGLPDGYGANAREIGLISIWFLAHGSIFRRWCDISVLLVLWQCCWGFSRVQSSKSRFFMCLIGKTQLLCMKCRVIGPHLVASGKSHWFSRVEAGTWGIFSSYNRDAPSKLEFV